MIYNSEVILKALKEKVPTMSCGLCKGSDFVCNFDAIKIRNVHTIIMDIFCENCGHCISINIKQLLKKPKKRRRGFKILDGGSESE